MSWLNEVRGIHQHWIERYEVEIQSLQNRQFYLHWLSLRAPEALIPLRGALDPLTIPRHLLPHIFLTSIEQDPFRVLFRLQGDYIVSKAGQHLRGKYICEETLGANWKAVENLYRTVVETGHPLLSVERQTGARNWAFTAEIIHAPLLNDNGDVAYVVGAFDHVGQAVSHHVDASGPEEWEVLESNASPLGLPVSPQDVAPAPLSPDQTSALANNQSTPRLNDAVPRVARA